MLIQSNPLLADDELGLLARYGLRYATTDPAVVLPQEDGDLLVMSRDLAATADELARFSAADARAFTALITAWPPSTAAGTPACRWASTATPTGRCGPGRPGT